MMLNAPEEQFLGTVDTHDLHDIDWPFIRLFFPHFVEEMELGRYIKNLVRSHHWRAVRAVPHDIGGSLSDHVFDVYAVPR